MRKRLKLFVFVMVLAFSLASNSLPAFGSSIEFAPIQPFWDNVDTMRLNIVPSGDTATCIVRIEGKSGTTHISATITLARVNANGTHTVVRRWSNQSVSGRTLVFSETHSVTSGNTYRLSVTAVVTRNGVRETVSSWTERSL